MYVYSYIHTYVSSIAIMHADTSGHVLAESVAWLNGAIVAEEDAAVAAASPDLTQWGSEASSSAETGGDEYPAGCDALSDHASLRDDAQLRDTLMFIDGGSPGQIQIKPRQFK